MANNPLQQYFRQPKVFITLPSHGVYNDPSDFNGSIENTPVFGMTSMDEILLKTPDALLTGESTVRVIQSCCPAVTDGWKVNNLDIDALLVAIRIATSGNTMTVTKKCPKCGTENEFDIGLNGFLDHFANCKFDNKVVVGDLTIKIRPLSYKKVTDFNLENFALQKKLYQAVSIENEEEKNLQLNEIYKEIGILQNKIYVATIEQVETPETVVTEREFIKEWVDNADKAVTTAIKQKVDENNEAWKLPDVPVKCDNCGADDALAISLDQSSFFGDA